MDHLPGMSSDVLLHFGTMSELWWNLAGVGPSKELPVPFWMREERRRNELLEVKNEVSELKKGLSRLEQAVSQIGKKADEKADEMKQTLQMIYKLVNGISGKWPVSKFSQSSILLNFYWIENRDLCQCWRLIRKQKRPVPVCIQMA